jgi:hypothetical protein
LLPVLFPRPALPRGGSPSSNTPRRAQGADLFTFADLARAALRLFHRIIVSPCTRGDAIATGDRDRSATGLQLLSVEPDVDSRQEPFQLDRERAAGDCHAGRPRALAFRRWRQAAAPQNITDRLVGDLVPQIRKCPGNPVLVPVPVRAGLADNQLLDLSSSHGLPGLDGPSHRTCWQ